MAGHTWHSLAKSAARFALVAAAFGWNGVDVFSQTPAPGAARPAPCRRTFTKNTTFSLPLQIDDATRATLSEVQLFVKTGAHDWMLHESTSPNTPFFTCKAPADGEYQFMLVTVDQSGKHNPAELSGQSPVLRVIVDTRAPTLEASASVESGAAILRVNMIDANPDLKSIQALAITEAGERALSPISGMPACFQLHPADLAHPIRITGIDMSGNQAIRQISPRELIDSSPSVAAWSTAQPVAQPVTQPVTQHIAQAAATPATPVTPMASLPPAPKTPAASSIKLTPPSSPTIPLPTIVTAPQGNVVAGYRPAVLPERTEEPAGTFKHIPGMINYKIEASAPVSVGRIDITLTPERTASTSPKIPEEVGQQNDDVKKLVAERDDLRAQVAQRNRERDEMNVKLAEGAKEIADLRAQIAVRTQERNQLAQELRQIPRDLQAILLRVEAQQGGIPPAGPMLPEPSGIRRVE